MPFRLKTKGLGPIDLIFMRDCFALANHKAVKLIDKISKSIKRRHIAFGNHAIIYRQILRELKRINTQKRSNV